MGCKKKGAKKQGHCYSKREDAANFSKVPDPKKISGRPDKLDIRDSEYILTGRIVDNQLFLIRS